MMISDSINIENACRELETLARQQQPSSAEVGAIELAAHGLLFITSPTPPKGSEHLRIEDVSARTVMIEWSSQGHLLDEYLAPWKEGIARDGTPEQRAFVALLEQPDSPDSVEDEHEIETRPFADVLPQPTDAVRILDELAQGYASDSLSRTRAELAVQVMRFVVERGEVGAFGRYLEGVGKGYLPVSKSR